MNQELISDRHLREVDGLASASDKAAIRVRIIARSAVETKAGQHLVICLVNLLGRMTDLVSAIDLDLPNVPALVELPSQGSGADLLDALLGLVVWAVGDEVAVDAQSGDRAAEYYLCIGSDVAAPSGAIALHALADGWRAWVGIAAKLPDGVDAFGSKNPLGPFLAASLLSGEVFKRARGTTRGRWIEDFGYSLWSGETGAWSALENGPELAGLDLPPCYVIGAGAVGQGLLNIIGASDLASSYVVTIDDDKHDRTNFNRCFVAGVGDQGHPKVDAVARYRALANIGGVEFGQTLGEYLRSTKQGLRPDLAKLEADDIYDVVISCVDKGTSRQDVQGLWPRILIGGSTLGLSAKVISYDLAAGNACLACHNPPEKNGERLREMEQQIRALDAEQRRAFLADVPDTDEILAYLENSDGCGSAGEAALTAFATQSAREFSASFVSMAASVLTAARLFAKTLWPESPPPAPMASLAFLNGSIDHAWLSVDRACLKCGGKPKESFAANHPG